MKQHLSLNDLAAEVQRVKAEKRDFRVDTSRHLEVRPVVEDDTVQSGRLQFVVRDQEALVPLAEVEPTHYAHGQLIEKVAHEGWKWGPYYRAMLDEDPALLAYTLNRHFRRDARTRFVRTLDGKLRGFLGPTYRAMENWDLLDVILPALIERIGGDAISFESAGLTESKMYIKGFWKDVTMPTKVGDVVQAGFAFGNSEVGNGPIYADPMVKILSCTNGMWSPMPGLRVRHVGRRITAEERAAEVYSAEALAADDRALVLKARDVILATADETRLAKVVAKIDNAADQKIDAGLPATVEVVGKQFDFTKREQDGILSHLAAGGDLSQWGMAQAVTRYSQRDEVNYDRASDLEKIGWKVMELKPEAWSVMNKSAIELERAA